MAQTNSSDVVILAGGKGTRLRDRIGDKPKPMVDIAGKPLLAWQIELARSQGFTNVLLLVQHRAEVIREYFGDGSRFGIELRYILESSPRGTAGAVLDALSQLSDHFIVMYGDTVLDVDLKRFRRFHVEANADVSLFLHPNDHPYDSDLVAMDQNGRIANFFLYPHPDNLVAANLVNAALYAVDRSALEPFRCLQGIIDFAKNLFPRMLAAGYHLHGYVSPEYIKDAGTPERVDKVNNDLKSGLVAARSIRNAAPAVFLDRDGVLNREVNRVSKPEQLELIEGVPAAIRKLNRSVFRTVVITNQPVVARGDCDEEALRLIHAKLDTLLGKRGAYLDALYYCPHHPDSGFAGERPDLKIECGCRKPGTGLIERAKEELNIDLRRSWLIGDTTVDFATARNADLRSICVLTGYAGKDGRYPVSADFEFSDLEKAVDFILRFESAPLISRS